MSKPKKDADEPVKVEGYDGNPPFNPAYKHAPFDIAKFEHEMTTAFLESCVNPEEIAFTE